MRAVLMVLALLLVGGCAASQPPVDPASQGVIDPIDYGPTAMRKVEGGYELANRRLRVVIHERSGDVTYFGSRDRNVLDEAGARLLLLNQRPADPDGYVEKRDDETWQYLGDTLTGIRWRKIYCLHHNALAVTALIENRTRDPIDTAIALRAAFAGGEVIAQSADVHERRFDGLTVRLYAFNEGKPEKPDWATLVGDYRTLKPGERIGITMEWRLSDAEEQEPQMHTDSHR